MRLRQTLARLRPGLMSRLVLALVATGLSPLLIVPYLVGLSRDAVSDQVLRTHAVAARSAASRVDAFLESLVKSGEAIALNPEIQSRPRSDAGRELLAGLLQAQPLILGAVVQNAGGQEVIRAQARGRADVVNAVLAAPSARPVVPRREFGILWLRLALPFADGRGRLLLVVEATPIEAVLDNEELGREAAILVATAEGEVIVASEPGVTLEDFPDALIDAGRSRRVSGASRFAGTQGSGDALGAYAPVTSAGWFVLSRQPAWVAEEVAVEMNRRALLALLATLAFTGLLAGVAYVTFVRPFRELVQAQQRLGHGNQTPRGASELEQLREGLAALERQTLDREALGQVFLGRYLVMEVIGSGGMGTVFRGWDPKLERPVALKTVHIDATLPATLVQEQRNTLRREAVSLAKITHPNIVAVYDVEDRDELAFIAMEYIDGFNLQRYLARTGPLRPHEVVPLGRAMAEGLAAAHGHGVIHRDVKPGNVLLGLDGVVKVTDFGIAGRVAGDSGPQPVFGTPGYLPPEALQGEPQEEPGDLFALGVILYECLAGQLPFHGASVQETMLRTQTGSLVFLRAMDPEVPPELDALVLTLLERDPARRRPAHAREVAAILDDLARRHGWSWRLRSDAVQDARPTMRVDSAPIEEPRTPRSDRL